MPINEAGLELVKKWEGLNLEAYQDCVKVWTIGWGHTGTVNGQKIKAGMKISKAQAETLLKNDLAGFWSAVCNPNILHLTNQMNDNQRSAMCSFAFNLGTNCLKTISQVSKNGQFVRWRTMDEVAEAITLYNKAGGIYRKGLMDRRIEEQLLFRTGSTKKEAEHNMDTLRKGDRGTQVKALQIILNAKYGVRLNIDGEFGEKTRAAVMKVQRDYGLTVDGICGPKTWEKILG